MARVWLLTVCCLLGAMVCGYYGAPLRYEGAYLIPESPEEAIFGKIAIAWMYSLLITAALMLVAIPASWVAFICRRRQLSLSMTISPIIVSSFLATATSHLESLARPLAAVLLRVFG